MWSKIYLIYTFPHLEILNYPVTLENKTNKQQQRPLKVKRNILAQITENKYFFLSCLHLREAEFVESNFCAPCSALMSQKKSGNCLKIIIL